ncbi:MAG: hypothetical protein WCJ30_04700 [Deltaproteobacteria bacterium]
MIVAADRSMLSPQNTLPAATFELKSRPMAVVARSELGRTMSIWVRRKFWVVVPFVTMEGQNGRSSQRVITRHTPASGRPIVFPASSHMVEAGEQDASKTRARVDPKRWRTLLIESQFYTASQHLRKFLVEPAAGVAKCLE